MSIDLLVVAIILYQEYCRIFYFNKSLFEPLEQIIKINGKIFLEHKSLTKRISEESKVRI